jgi:hypothetical protein
MASAPPAGRTRVLPLRSDCALTRVHSPNYRQGPEPWHFLRVDPTLALAGRVELYVVNQLPDAWILYFPFPFLLLLTLLLWLAALAWRSRRIRKLERGLAMDA